jgi:hypothetical protein
MSKIIALLALSSLLGACATSPIASGEASAGKPVTNQFQTPAADSGSLIVTRDSGFMGAACSQKIYVDGTQIGSLRSGQKVQVYLPAGEHVAGVMSGGMCGGGSSSTQIIVKAGGTKHLRVASGQSGDIKIEPSAF